MLDKLYKAFRVGVPIVAIETSDEIATQDAITKFFCNADDRKASVLVWDCVSGITAPAWDERSMQGLANIGDPMDYQGSPRPLLMDARKIPERTVVIIRAAGEFIQTVQIWQAILNIRDEFKENKRMLVLMGAGVLPPALQHNTIVFSEPLPSEQRLAEIVSDVCEWAEIPADAEHVQSCAKAALGVTEFAAENLAALACTVKETIDIKGLWESKARKIAQTPGLSVVQGPATGFDAIGGCEAIKTFLKRVMEGRAAPAAIVYVDEIEKCLGGAAGDTSGVSQDQLGQMLTWMQDNQASGVIFKGPPGAAKSEIAKATGSQFGIPTIQLDLGAAMGSLVGQSQQMIREALRVVHAVSGGNTFWMATCNSDTNMPPELKRRFRFGTWFFDLPDETEREAIWTIYCTRHGLPMPDATMIREQEWTGAEIKTCCELAYNLQIDIAEAANYIVPVSKQAAEQIKQLRASAEWKLLSASYAGPYRGVGAQQKQPAKSGRKIG